MKNIGNQLGARSEADASLRSDDFTVIFKHEGKVKIRVPRFLFFDFLFAEKRKLISNIYSFSRRPGSEALLRTIVYRLYKDGILDAGKSIVDIGAWIGDNSIIWAKLLDPENAVVYAVDPSAANIEFGKKVAALNGCSNISWHVAACSDVEGQKLYYQGSIGHTRFNEGGAGKLNPAQSTTLDRLVGEQNWHRIGLVHLDVEGMERSVLAGAREIIARSKPVVVFEQHIGEENPFDVFALLEAGDYRLFVINELLSDSASDCRNFIAFPAGMDLPAMPRADFIKGREQGIWYATQGDAILPFLPE